VKRVDAFPFAGTPTELLLLECRLTELFDVVDAFVIVEATTDHQDHPKPLNYMENRERFAAWQDKIVYIVADGLPSKSEDDWSWAREHAQREWIAKGLGELDIEDDDIVLQSDLDEIPHPLTVRNIRLRGTTAASFRQRGHFWAIDWLYPPGWSGTVAMRAGAIESLRRPNCGPFTAMRDKRNANPLQLPNAGWHFSWLGGPEAARRKVGSFCHPEVEDKILWDPERYWREGWHVDDVKMVPVDVDATWPKWMQNPANVLESWLRPR
jgi:hypothetical protein